MKQHKFSIITVVYDLDELFWATSENLRKQTFVDFEWVIKPAKKISRSDHGRLLALGLTLTIIVEPDRGIYNAMNIATAQARGQYLFFLNSGDFFADESVLKSAAKAAEQNNDPALIYGEVCVGAVTYVFPDPLTKFFLFRNALCHQAYFISRSIGDGRMTFDEAYKVLADHEFVLRNMDALLRSQLRLPFRISDVPEMGFSARNAELKRTERRSLVRRYFPFKRYARFHAGYALTFPKLRLWLFDFPLYRRLRASLLYR